MDTSIIIQVVLLSHLLKMSLQLLEIPTAVLSTTSKVAMDMLSSISV